MVGGWGERLVEHCTFQNWNPLRVFLYHCISDGNWLFSEDFGCHFHFILHVMSDKAFVGRGSTETPSKLFANHNALEQLANHNTFRFSEGGPSSNPELIEPFVWGWGERYCNNVNYVKNNVIFEPPSMRACSSTPPKQNQDFVKEHNRTPLSKYSLKGKVHPKMKVTPWFTHPQAIIVVDDFLLSDEYNQSYIKHLNFQTL